MARTKQKTKLEALSRKCKHMIQKKTYLALVAAFMLLTPLFSYAQDGGTPVARDGFRVAVRKAARNARKAKKITPRQYILLNVAMISPNFRKAAEDLAIIQMTFSGFDLEEQGIPVDAEGRIIRTEINWDAIIAFLEELIPLIIQLIEIFNDVSATIEMPFTTPGFMPALAA